MPAKCMRLSGRLSTARRFYVSYDTTFLLSSHKSRSQEYEYHAMRCKTRYVPYALAPAMMNLETWCTRDKTIVVISATKTYTDTYPKPRPLPRPQTKRMNRPFEQQLFDNQSFRWTLVWWTDISKNNRCDQLPFDEMAFEELPFDGYT